MGALATGTLGGFVTNSGEGNLIGCVLGLGGGIVWTVLSPPPPKKTTIPVLKVSVACQIGILDLTTRNSTLVLQGRSDSVVSETPEGIVFLTGDI